MKSPRKPEIVVSVVLVFLSLNSDKLITTCNRIEDVWRDAGRMTGLLLQNCMQVGSNAPQEQFLLILMQCIKGRSLLFLDRALNDDVIKLSKGIELIRYRRENDTHRSFSMIEPGFKLNENETDWKTQVLHRIAHLFTTHVLKIRLNGHEGLAPSEGRFRRKRNSMMLSLIMFGVVAVGLVVIPMGFQFLAVLGGKALLLAKMALLLTSIQGLKKIATSNLNYGLYSAPEHGHGHGHHGHCNDEWCNKQYNPLESDDSVFFLLEVDDISNSYLKNYDSWHYDRQWPFETQENHDENKPYSYYDAPDQQTDLLHPFQPRKDLFKNMM